MKGDTGLLEVNGRRVGLVKEIEFKIPESGEFKKFLKEFAEFVQDVESHGMSVDEPMHCPYDSTRGCVCGNVYLLKHIEHENHMETQMIRLKDQRCRAWSNRYGRCLRLEPVTSPERMKENYEKKRAAADMPRKMD